MFLVAGRCQGSVILLVLSMRFKSVVVQNKISKIQTAKSDLCSRVAECIEADGGIFEYLL
jgi:hypothetical protein